MAHYTVLFNPYAGNGKGAAETKRLEQILSGHALEFVDMTKISDYDDFFRRLLEEHFLVITGGDGTLNRFVNAVSEKLLTSRDIYYFATGTGNDFLLDIGGKKGGQPIKINKYITRLPTITVNGMTRKFINGIGYGIDGYCCEEGDKLRAVPGKKINYTVIALKGLLGKYSPTEAVITVDGKSKSYKKAWMAPSMNGRYFGGGVMPTPDQDRLNNSTLSLMVFHSLDRFRTLIILPTVYKGKHIKYTKVIDIFKGKEITVKFNRPTALQIDGETVLAVTEYSVKAFEGARTEKKEKELIEA